MEKGMGAEFRLSDYRLNGTDTVLAIEKGLADAAWYASPVPREKMRELQKRRDGPAIRDSLLWFALLGVFGSGGFLLWGSWWAVFPFAVYGVLYASVSDSRWHESLHGTAFRTDWMNNALYELASFMVLRESVSWRWSHTRHHSDTLIVGRDPEIIVQRPPNLAIFVTNFFNVTAFWRYWSHVFLHCTGRLTEDERSYVPENQKPKLFARARIYVLIYSGVIALSALSGSMLPLMYVGLPTLYGAWLMVVYGYTQHAGLAENVLDHRLDCRTVYMNPVNRYLYWNMNYHVEHHMFPLVPYHALPELHELIKPDSPAPYAGLWDAYREIIPTVLRQAGDPGYFVKRQLPAPVGRAFVPEPDQIVVLDGRTPVDGWLEVCDGDTLQRERVLRFDRDQMTYAMYRTSDDRCYATDGLCTHGNAHLADGMVKGTLIECAKHNGRYDIRDGSPQRLPVCVGLKTYPVRQTGGKLYVDLSSAGGDGITRGAPAYTFRVVSNLFVASFIKELVLEPTAGSSLPAHQPGDYMQIDIPPYPRRSLGNVEVDGRFANTWKVHGVNEQFAANTAPCRRNYSMASNPAIESVLRFNVRLATPPRGVDCNAGAGSAYIFGLKPGDIVNAIGPFGQFHIKNTDRETVYLGGGAGMAPLRSHLSYLFETFATSARVSYWYGARSLQELFYTDYFEGLAREHSNFSFHVALSEPLPRDEWQSHKGFIHEVLKREYLARHPDPTNVEYFLCGPPAMVQAATVMLKNLGVPPAQIAYDEF
jgi:Na+-transporting NADH:ubiquinone oxidoreductase subunit F